jgi:hypothetical protein
MDHSFKTADFLMKKGFVNISLGLKYFSIGSSWPWSHETMKLSLSVKRTESTKCTLSERISYITHLNG